MKKIGFVLLLVFIAAKIFAQEVQLTNNDFEEWSDNQHPTGWNTEIYNQGITIYTAEKTTDAYSGNYAVLLETQRIVTNDIVPGMIQLGRLNIDDLVPEGAVEFNGGRPTGYKAYVKYFPVGGDSLVTFLYLVRYNDETGKVDTIGGSLLYLTDQIPEYKELIVPIYYVKDGDPDSINIGFFSSGFAPHEGSKLYVDKIELIYDELNFAPYALPASDQTDSSFVAHWSGFANATSYIIDVAYDRDFTHYLEGYEHLNVGDTDKYPVKTPKHLTNVYYFRVKAVYDTIISDYSNTVKVIIPWETTAHEAQNITAISFLAAWDTIPEATHYMFQVALDPDFKNYLQPYEYYPIDTNVINVINLEPETEYYYRVAVRYGKLSSKFSNVVKVKTTQLTDNDQLKIYGYPDKISIYTYKTLFDGQLLVYSAEGKLIFSQTIDNTLTTISIPGPSIYVVTVITPEGKILKKKVLAGY